MESFVCRVNGYAYIQKISGPAISQPLLAVVTDTLPLQDKHCLVPGKSSTGYRMASSLSSPAGTGLESVLLPMPHV